MHKEPYHSRGACPILTAYCRCACNLAAEVPALPIADVAASMELPAESSHHSVHAMRQQEFALAAPLDVGALYAQNQNKLKLLQVSILGDETPQHPNAAPQGVVGCHDMQLCCTRHGTASECNPTGK